MILLKGLAVYAEAKIGKRRREAFVVPLTCQKWQSKSSTLFHGSRDLVNSGKGVNGPYPYPTVRQQNTPTPKETSNYGNLNELNYEVAANVFFKKSYLLRSDIISVERLQSSLQVSDSNTSQILSRDSTTSKVKS
ncbi:hypothetical protein RND71_003391 [Anisodus tanguticus]|uniref:Uncharacterized protein n=1 Tax=Anisodus tanguticus TaxID=243964 RepID=A0AAE1VX24_9SOLA|nr:hypothetical protein RND71_003391 [Anisodus tanguticus]